ncbi:Mesaconyl-C(4)-CoA hydratase [Apiospora marii]|uniref:Mesaconyl-C(4)-CoA hydratase n=1 Tax=Apiospora marii TaxID=335849 RepID=A0ABR1RM61_9PEZI
MRHTFRDRVITRRQILDGNQLQKLSLTLGRPHLHPGLDVSETPPPDGTPLPPGYHLVYFTPNGTERELGPDGTDLTFNAPAPFTRRMWAGGRMLWKAPAQLRVGQQVEERTRLLAAAAKKRLDGEEMVLVEVEKEFWGPEGLALVDERSWAFLPAMVNGLASPRPALDTTVLGPSTVEDLDGGDGGYPSRQFRWSPVGLFRFSALTFNGHKIHYDGSWARSVEGHPGPVVHGPLNLINMLDYWRDVCGGPGAVNEIRYRAMAPLHTGDTYQMSAQKRVGPGDGKPFTILVQKGNVVCMKSTIVAD